MIKLVYILIFSFCLSYALTVYFGVWPFNGWQLDEIGQFGDSWGVLTSIFSAFAFAAVIHNNITQKKTIEKTQEFSNKQSEFLNIQTIYLNNQTEFLNKQNEFIRVQKFESSLFQMLTLFQSIIEDIDLSGKNSRKGRDCFKLFYSDLDYEFKNSKLYATGPSFMNGAEINEFKDLFSEVYHAFYLVKQQDLGHYFRFLYNIFKYIHDSGLSDKEMKVYGNIVRAQLSNYELAILFYNCIYIEGRKFEKYAIQFQLFDNMPDGLLLRYEHKYLINAAALGNRG